MERIRNYELEYHVKNVGVFSQRFTHYPTEKELQFLVDRTDIDRATIWKQTDTAFIRVIDLI